MQHGSKKMPGALTLPPSLNGNCTRQYPPPTALATSSNHLPNGHWGHLCDSFPSNASLAAGTLRAGAIHRSQSAPHMHVLGCRCSNVRQFHDIRPEPLNCYATLHCSHFLSTCALFCQPQRDLHGARQVGGGGVVHGGRGWSGGGELGHGLSFSRSPPGHLQAIEALRDFACTGAPVKTQMAPPNGAHRLCPCAAPAPKPRPSPTLFCGCCGEIAHVEETVEVAKSGSPPPCLPPP